MHTTRRRVLAGAGASVAASLAGCVDALGAPGSDGETAASSSFFVFGDVAAAVAGDAASAETLVPVGQHGHGWEPGPRVQGRVLQSDLFVSVVPGFQPWVDDVRRSLERDGADVHVVEAARGVDLLDAPGHDGEETHDEETHDEESHDEESHDGEETHDDGDAHDDEERDGDHEGDGHPAHVQDGVDPHFWLDPRRVASAVENVRAGFASVDPERSGTYAATATAYREELAALDEAFESALADATRETVLVAGHNSFRYLGERYGFHVEALTGLSPDDRPTHRTIARAQAVVEEHDIEHVLAPQFESDSAARQLVAETDATGVVPVTALPGRAEEWAERGWGYLDVMREVNLPAFREALGA